MWLLHLVSVQVVCPAPQTAARQWSATGRTSGPHPSPSSLSPSSTSLLLNPHSPSLCCHWSQATSLGCRPAPAPALDLTAEARWGRTAKMQLKTCTGTRAPWLQQPPLPAPFGLPLWGATPQSGSRGHPTPQPAQPARWVLAQHTASPARSQQALAQRTPHPQEIRDRLQRSYHLPLHLLPWGWREGWCHRCCQQWTDTVSTLELWPVYHHPTVTHLARCAVWTLGVMWREA